MSDLLTPKQTRQILGLTELELGRIQHRLGVTRTERNHRQFDQDKVLAYRSLLRTIITLQPSSFTDQITSDGTELTKLPYPFHVEAATGDIQRQDFWRGDPFRVIGFQNDPHVQHVDLWWDDVAKDPQSAVGKYPVTVKQGGGMAGWSLAIESVTVQVSP